jgi:hypothetical protein
VISALEVTYRQSVDILHGLLELGKCEKRFAAIKIDKASRSKKGMEKIYGLDQGRKTQAFFSSWLITVGAVKIAVVG